MIGRSASRLSLPMGGIRGGTTLPGSSACMGHRWRLAGAQALASLLGRQQRVAPGSRL